VSSLILLLIQYCIISEMGGDIAELEIYESYKYIRESYKYIRESYKYIRESYKYIRESYKCG